MTRCQWQNSREVVERITVQGVLALETPARFGNGDGDGLVDMPLFLDPLEGRALLTGASLAGALRSYLRERQHGFGAVGSANSLFAQLFGGIQEQDEAEQSPLITYDALSERPVTELRDGVAIEARTRTAEDKKKYDFELLEAGTSFPLRLELLVTEARRADLLRGLALALQGLERGEIPLGARKRRGFGACVVKEWNLRRYDLRTPDGLLAWLGDDSGIEERGASIATLLRVADGELAMDERKVFTVQATFAIAGSLLIRSGFGESGEPDAVHLHSKRRGATEPAPILSGTSLAGALRARALRIATVVRGKEQGRAFVDGMFGMRPRDSRDQLTASPLVALESEITTPLPLVQTRVKIDRFTGGTHPTALFSEQPIFGGLGGKTRVAIGLQLRSTREADTDARIGLLLLLLKDLWTGDLPLGGEAGVGRGRLRGIRAELRYDHKQWGLGEEANGKLTITGDTKQLEQYVQALWGDRG